ncbi:hypothetical protein [Bradyrhizobium pachyrhizi]|uniref:hypothetical protein n=1 Tax=Bradyrhizobium pachyrhizi TaxID=280333 RepID=UPI0012E3F885|nr:hypothetical protein [Bradyrhizobium pachyrhizi]
MSKGLLFRRLMDNTGRTRELENTFEVTVSGRTPIPFWMWAIASAVPHFGWSNGEGAIKGAALAVLFAGLLDRPLPDRLPGWATDWI